MKKFLIWAVAIIGVLGIGGALTENDSKLPAKTGTQFTPQQTTEQITTPNVEVAQPVPEPEPEPEVQAQTYIPPPAVVSTPKPAPPQSNCDPNYTPCVPNVSYDLDCPDIGFSVTVIGFDPHGFDGNDNDGLGCESY